MDTRDRQQRLLLPPISAAAPGALYEQIVDGIKREVSEGRLAPGTALPSFRVLAENLLVSVITVKRAYEELERLGIIFRKQGLGTFVSEDGAARSREVKREHARALLREALREGTEAGLSDEEMLGMVEELLADGER
ncbi:MAG TPA: GntR family transcriptional regulator [Candidatus Hydrogenedentes bacterium]|nr:GntR family transcriptional regulator [Candidatus Hydrogenedentota bacterium]HPG70379.1 GntR family transcriptional regulator [Candidatus Hydrogenedentota bacterium]